jgi:hypothetical protein
MAVAIRRVWHETVSQFHMWGFWAGNRTGHSAVYRSDVSAPTPRVGKYVADYSFLSEADLDGVDTESAEILSKSKVLSSSREL